MQKGQVVGAHDHGGSHNLYYNLLGHIWLQANEILGVQGLRLMISKKVYEVYKNKGKGLGRFGRFDAWMSRFLS